MLAAQELGRPVKWVATRSEVFLSDNHGRGLTLTGELALDREGRFLALRFEDTADLGAFSTPFGPQIGTRNITVTMGGVYRIPAMFAHTRCAYSNAVPVSAYRGAGRPDIACAIERLVDRAAAEHGFDPIALRPKNFIPPQAWPYKTPTATRGNGAGWSRAPNGEASGVKLRGPNQIPTASPQAAAALGAEASANEYRGGKFHAASRSIGFFELAQKLVGTSPHPMDCIAEGTFGATFPNGCHIAEVEIDPETGVVDVTGYATVDDIGNVVDHTSVEGQVHGGVLQGVSQVLAEHAIYDSDTGQLLAGSFMDYPMPRADWMRAIRCDEHPVPTQANALGAKGVGESGTSGALGATMNAILDAVRPAGITDLDMPVTPDRLWRALREARSK